MPMKARGGGNPVSADDLARLLNMRQVPIVILNACQSGKQIGAAETSLGSRMLDAGAQLVVAMGYSVTVSAARLLMTTLYRQLLDGRDPAIAIRRGRLELFNNKQREAAFGQKIELEDWLLPVIYQNRAPGFDHNTFQGEVMSVAAGYAPPRTAYRFVGREIENRLLSWRNLLLVRGMGGAGKTTLLHHLGWWWQKTRFVDKVFYFGYDQKAYRLLEIVSAIGEQLGLRLSGRAAQDRVTILRSLKSTRCLLVLDNLESITGEPLAVQNTLPLDAQADLRAFSAGVGGEVAPWCCSALAAARRGCGRIRCGTTMYTTCRASITRPRANWPRRLSARRMHRGYPEQPEHQAAFRRLLKLLGRLPIGHGGGAGRFGAHAAGANDRAVAGGGR